MPDRFTGAVDLTEALSTRLPLPADALPEWHRNLRGLQHTWDLITDLEPAQ